MLWKTFALKRQKGFLLTRTIVSFHADTNPIVHAAERGDKRVEAYTCYLPSVVQRALLLQGKCHCLLKIQGTHQRVRLTSSFNRSMSYICTALIKDFPHSGAHSMSPIKNRCFNRGCEAYRNLWSRIKKKKKTGWTRVAHLSRWEKREDLI